MAQGSSVSLVFSALVVMATAGSYPEVKNVVDKKCVECYGHIANAYLECIQASIKHPLHPERAAEECTKAQNDALTFCPDYCMKKPEPPHPGPPHPGPPIPGPPIPGPPEPPTPEPVEEISYNLDPEEDVPVTYDQLITLQSFLENNKPDEDTVSPKCRLCYGRIASAFIDCMKGTYDHPHRPKMVELLCNQAVKKANKACSKETCISASGGSKCNTAAADIKTLSTEDFVLQEKDDKLYLGQDVLPPATMEALKDSNKFGNGSKSSCIACYGRIATAYLNCLQTTFSHPNEPELIKRLCDKFTSQALEYCPDGCFNKDHPPMPYPPHIPPIPVPPMPVNDDKLNEVEDSADEVEVEGAAPKSCPPGQRLCEAMGSGNKTCCPKDQACCGELKWDVGAICCPKGWCCNKKESYYVPQCVPPLLC